MDHRPSSRPSRRSRTAALTFTFAALAALACAGCGGGSTPAPPPATLGVASVSPSAGPSAGGTPIAVTGAAFTTGARVRLGGVDATQVVVVSATRITAVAPAHAGGTVDVEVSDAAGHADALGAAFTYVDPPAVSFVDPGHVPQAGGTVVLHGQAFADGAAVRFGADTAVGQVQRLSPLQLVAVAPAHAAGVVDVTVVNPDGQQAVLFAGLAYDADPPPPPATNPPVLAAVAPDAGSEGGGTVVTLTGSDFDPGVVVTIGGAPTTVTAHSATSLTVTTPPHAPGLVDVMVQNPDGRTSTRAGAFTYVALPPPPPALASVAPSSGPEAGGTTVLLSGTGFQAGATVTFGAAPAVVMAQTPDTLTVMTGSHPAALVAVEVVNPDGQRSALAGAFTYLATPVLALQSVSPASGPTAGGTRITLQGTAFAAGATVTVGGAAATGVTVTSTTITATTPAHAAGVVPVAVSNPGGATASLPLAFSYVAPPAPTPSAAAPSSGPDLGGTLVTISGSGFQAGATVSFGAAHALVGSVTAATISVTAPPHAAGAVDLTVTNPDGQQGTLSAGFVYLPPPQLAGLAPVSGPVAGGTLVALTGAGFQAGASVSFGGAPARVLSLASSDLVAEAPAHAAGPVDVLVVNPDGRLAALTGAFTYLAPPPPPPVLATVSPTSGTTLGGTSVVLGGTGFDAAAAVTFGGAAATVSARSATSLTVTTPAHAAGLVDVAVVNGDGQRSSLAGAFTFVAPPPPPPAIGSLSPASGPASGGTAVTIAGSNFVAGLTVTVGGAAATVGAVTAGSVSVVTPVHAAGAVGVTVTNPDGQSSTLAGGFTYVAPPALASLTPTSGLDGGGQAVTLAGSGFQAGATVTFGGSPATVGAVTATSLAATTPPHAAGTVAVTVTNPDGQASTLASGYAYLQPAPAIASASPASGPTAGGTVITVSGSNFQAGATATLGGSPAVATVVSASTITLTAPAHAAGAAGLAITNPDGQAATLPGAFTYLAPPALATVAPASGTTQGGTSVVLGGTGFDAAAAVSFGGSPAVVTTRSATSLTVTTPGHAAGPADVVVLNGDGQSATKAGGFTFVAPPPPAPALLAVTPSSGSTAGGTAATISGSNFAAGLTVTVGGTAATVGAVTATGIAITTPAHAAGAVGVTVTNPDGQSSTLAGAFTYLAPPPPPPLLASVSPIEGPDAGGTLVSLSGSAFAAGATVTFGGAPAVVGTVTSGSILAQAPAHVAGLVDVTVTNPDGQASTLHGAFTFVSPPPPPPVLPAPVLASVLPATGPTAGGTVVALSGANFQAGATVTLGGVQAVVGTVGAGAIDLITPAHAAGAVDVTVTNPDGQRVTLPAAFTYLAPPALLSLAPASGLTTGGTAVTLSGTDFSAGATVSFGGATATVVTRTATSIAVTAPAHAAGAVGVTVTNPDGQSSTLASAYTYVLPPPAITSVSPTSGTTLGGTVVTVTGSGFQAGATATLGGSPAVVGAVTASSLTLTTPAHAAGLVALSVTNPDGQVAALAAAFTFVLPPPALASVAPASGPTAGGTAVTLSGSGFQPGATVSVGGTAAAVGAVSATSIAITTPVHAAGAVGVTVTNPDGQSSTLSAAYTFVAPPALVAIAPPSGPTAGGTAVVLSGTGFAAGATVSVGGSAALVGAVSATSVAITTPAHAAGAVGVTVTNPDGQSSTLAGAFTYLAPPALLSLAPSSGLTTGGTAVTLGGTGFSAGATVSFGGVAATVVTRTATSIAVTTPAHAAGAVGVTVTNPDGQSSTLASGYTYVLPPPAITSLSPTSGTTLGGTAVTVTGSGFQAGATAALGGSPAVVGAVTATSLTLTTPAHAAGLVALTVTNPDGQAATLASAFTYVTPPPPPPTLASLSPTSGPDAGGTAVTLSGGNFSAGATVTFGGSAATVGTVTATTIAVVTPAHLAGSVDVVVVNPGGQAATLVAAYTFVAPPPPPVLSSVLPTTGTTAGGTAVSLTGAAFQAGATVRFGGVAASVVSSAATTIAVTTPAHAAGAVDVSVTNPDGQATTLPAAFTYQAPPPPPPTLSGLSPVSGTTAGGTAVTLTGSAFSATVTVTFGGAAGAVTASSATSITATTPPHAAGAVDVVVTNADGQKATLPAAFGYVAPPPPPVLASVSPTSGTTAGGTHVVLSGTGFAAGATVAFGTAPATVQSLTATSLTVASPPGAAGTVAVTVTNSDGQSSTLPGAYTYLAPPPPPALASATPASGSTAGGTSVVLAGTGFVSGATVTVGGAAATVGGLTATAISITTPAHAAGAADVVVTNPDGQQATLAGGFTFVAPPPPPALLSVAPASGDVLGGTAVVLSGSGFAGGATVTFGGVAATVTATSATSISVTTPAHVAALVDVVVTNPDGQASTLAGAFTYAAAVAKPPVLSSLTPTSGFDVGGTVVTLSGSEFVNPVVAFGGVAVAPSASTKTSITVTTPPHAAGLVDVTVTNQDGQRSTLAGAYTYVAVPVIPPPVIGSLDVTSGPETGNTLVTITGTGFTSGATVTFGGVAGLGVVVVSGTTITVTTPGGPAGPVDVTVTNFDRQASTLVGGFTYVAPPPVVTAINVRGSPQAGGGLLLFAGTGLGNTVAVTFGGVSATGLTFDPVRGTLTVTVPASPLGPTTDGFVDLVLTNLDGQSTTWPNFHYGNPPNPTGFTPATGRRGDPLVISGTDFTADTTGLRVGLQVSFGGTFAVISAKTSTSITVAIPKLNPGVYQVLVTNFDSQFAISPGTFTAPGP